VTNFALRLEVPSRDVALIVNFGPAFAVAGPGDSATPVAYDSFVAGLHDAPPSSPRPGRAIACKSISHRSAHTSSSVYR